MNDNQRVSMPHVPGVSVIVPIYNVEDELTRCVESILRQSYRDIEVILVDDGSTDSSPAICDAYAAQDGRIRVLHKPNGGLSDARNVGLNMACGKYVLYVDSDDYLDDNAVLKLLQGSADGADLIAGAYVDWKGDTVQERRRTGFQDGEIMNARTFIIRSVKNRCFMVQSWAYMYRREFLINNALYFKKGMLYEDLELAPRLFLSAAEVSCVGFTFYNRVFRQGSICFSPNSRKKDLDYLRILKKWKETFDGINDAELQKYLYHELIVSYLFMCKYHDINGWLIPGIDFRFAFSHSIGCRAKARVVKYELLFLLRRLRK